MNSFNIFLISIVVILFPIILNLFYAIYANNSNKEEILDFALLSSVYLFYLFYEIAPNSNFIYLLNIPLIISFIKKRSGVSIIISLITIIICYNNCHYSLIVLLIEYLTYYLIYLTQKKHFFKLFFIFKIIFTIIYFLQTNNINILNLINLALNLLIFYLALKLIIYMFKKAETIIKLNLNIIEQEKDKQIRSSLFKITHEIKNPIAVCKTYLDMFDFNNKDHIRYIPIIKEEIEKILLLLQDFLSMNRIKINKEILDINLLLEDVSAQFELLLRNKNIKFSKNISLDEVFIEGDYNRLNQVLVNLIKNSLEALDEKKDSFISLSYEIKNNNFKIIIEDNGIGIPKEEIEKIKEPFYTTKKNGTGLGVSLSCEIIKAHSGTIKYYSKVNEGTKVVIELPIFNI